MYCIDMLGVEQASTGLVNSRLFAFSV